VAKNYYLSGQWNVTCDVCSKKIKSSEARNRWDGLVTCPDCWEQRHPLDFIKARTDKITVPFQRPIPTLEFVPQNFTQPLTSIVNLEDNYARVATFTRAYTDSTSVNDSVLVQQGYGRSFTDTISFSEGFDTLVYTSLDLVDTVSITETLSNSVGIVKTSTVTLTDDKSNTVGLNSNDSVSFAETTSNTMSKEITDITSISEVLAFSQAANDAVNDTAINTQAIN